jgi:hypothetical protein
LVILFFTRRRKEPKEHEGKMRLLFENIVRSSNAQVVRAFFILEGGD